MTGKTTTFLLRITPEMKEAVRFLASNYNDIYEEFYQKKAGAKSMNEQFYHLISRALMDASGECSDAYNNTLQEEEKPLAEIMKFFLHNNRAESCGPDDFEDGSIERKHLVEHWAGSPDRSEITAAYADVLRRQKIRDQFINLQTAEFNSLNLPGVREAIRLDGSLAAASTEGE